ncbi:transposase [Shewanella insulae]|uniref:transposase n=1 Tax=Shewanella insulae TaxID=2681496 RepID=UPI003CE4E312
MMQRPLDSLTSVPGVGKVKMLSYTLLNEMPELEKLNRKEFVALVGIAPMNRESGSYKGKRRSRGRTVMFMAMMSAIQCSPVFKRYYQRLKAADKMLKVAPLIACMRKLIVSLNTMLKNEELWYSKNG